MSFITINAVTHNFELKQANIQTPVLVFINSLGTDFRIWENVRSRLDADISTLVYDKRGHGLSDIGVTPYSIDLLADDLIGLLGKLFITNAIICGLSVGGLIAQAVYLKRPDLVNGLILSNTAHKIGTQDMWNTRIDVIKRNGLGSIVEATMPRWFTNQFRSKGNPDYRAYYNMFVRQPLDGYIATCAALRDADFTQELKFLQVPTLCIAGEFDDATPPDLVRNLASLISNAEYTEIASSGHLPCIEQPEIYAQLINKFYSKNLQI